LTVASREPHVEAAERELTHRLYSLGIDVEPSVLAAYVERYGEKAFNAVVRDVAKALAASYRVPYAAGEAEELMKEVCPRTSVSRPQGGKGGGGQGRRRERSLKAHSTTIGYT